MRLEFHTRGFRSASLAGDKGLAWLSLILSVGTLFRLMVAPWTSGSDIPQFAGFADSFLRHGLHFYAYCGGEYASREGWAFPWPYVYGPVFLVVLGLLRLLAPGRVAYYSDGMGYHVYAPLDWILAVKCLYIFFDAISAALIYAVARAYGVSRERSLVAAALYYWNPMVFYISAIYGMLDPMVLAGVLAALLAYSRGTRRAWRISWTILGVTLAVKPTTLYAILPLLAYEYYSGRSIRGLLEGALLSFGTASLLYAPFFLSTPGSLHEYLAAVRSVSCPCYSVPTVYSFNGFSSIAFYIWNHTGEDTSWILGLYPLILGPLYIIAVYSASKSETPIEPVVLGYTAYTAGYWRVNHQYLVPTIGLLALAYALRRGRCSAWMAVAASALAGLWPLMYPISFWAWVHIPSVNPIVYSVLEYASLNIYNAIAYIYYSLALTLGEIAFILALYHELLGVARAGEPTGIDN